MKPTLDEALLEEVQRAEPACQSISVDEYTSASDQWKHGYAETPDGRRFWFTAVRGPATVAGERHGFAGSSGGELTRADVSRPDVVVPEGLIYVTGLERER